MATEGHVSEIRNARDKKSHCFPLLSKKIGKKGRSSRGKRNIL